MSRLNNIQTSRGAENLRIQMESFYSSWNSYLKETERSSETKTVQLSIQVFPFYQGSSKKKAETNNLIYQSSVTHTLEIPIPLAPSYRRTYLAEQHTSLKEGLLNKIKLLWETEIAETIAALPQEQTVEDENLSLSHVGVNGIITFTRYAENGTEVSYSFNTTEIPLDGKILKFLGCLTVAL